MFWYKIYAMKYTQIWLQMAIMPLPPPLQTAALKARLKNTFFFHTWVSESYDRQETAFDKLSLFFFSLMVTSSLSFTFNKFSQVIKSITYTNLHTLCIIWTPQNVKQVLAGPPFAYREQQIEDFTKKFWLELAPRISIQVFYMYAPVVLTIQWTWS